MLVGFGVGRSAACVSARAAWVASACTWRLTALWVSDSSSAAARKLRWRATASSARRWPTAIGRVRRRISVLEGTALDMADIRLMREWNE